MNDLETHMLERIRYWVWSGFCSEEQVQDRLADMIEDEAGEDADESVDEDMLQAAVTEAFDKKAAAEESWPAKTDCDKLNAVFKQLDDDGICAVHDAGYTMSEGYADVAEALHERGGLANYSGYCFYHGQDVERAVDGHGLSLAFGDLDDDKAKTLRIGRAIAGALREAGFVVEWNESGETRIDLPKIDWKRRSPV